MWLACWRARCTVRATCGKCVDPIRLRLRGVMFSQLRVRVRPPARSSSRHSGLPSSSTGSGVEAVKSVPMPITSFGRTPASAIARGAAVRSASSQSSGSYKAQSAGSGAPVAGTRLLITPCGNGCTALPNSAPSLTRTTTARSDSVRKSIPTTRAIHRRCPDATALPSGNSDDAAEGWDRNIRVVNVNIVPVKRRRRAIYAAGPVRRRADGKGVVRSVRFLHRSHECWRDPGHVGGRQRQRGHDDHVDLGRTGG